LLIESGGGTGVLEDLDHPLGPGMLINVPTGAVHSFSFKPGTEGWVVTLVSEVLDQYLHESEGLQSLLSQAVIVYSTSEISVIVQRIFEEFHSRNFARAHILRALSGLLAGMVARTISLTTSIDQRRDHPLKRRFEELIEEHYLAHLKVEEYASHLAVTPTHLTRVMRETTGQPASAAISERLIREARRNLAYSNLSISEIAYQLGFSDPAYFSRVFSRVTGSTPRKFRARIEGMPN